MNIFDGDKPIEVDPVVRIILIARGVHLQAALQNVKLIGVQRHGDFSATTVRRRGIDGIAPGLVVTCNGESGKIRFLSGFIREDS